MPLCRREGLMKEWRRIMEQNGFDRLKEDSMPAERQKKDGKFLKGAAVGAVAALVAVACIFGGSALVRNILTGGSYASGDVSENDVDQKLAKINDLIDRYYLYEDEIDEDSLIEGIYSGYASALGDPYTEYYDEEESQALLENTNGEFSGIGATLTQSSDGSGVAIVNVYEDSPADKAGLQAGDILYQVDDHEVQGEDLETVVSWVK